jgi:hypothetical protein
VTVFSEWTADAAIYCYSCFLQVTASR